MLDKYKSEGLVVLAINTQPEKKDDVLKLMKDNKLDFITLKPPHDKWAIETYNVTGTPANFLLDGQGRVIFKPYAHDARSARMLELEIQTILAHTGKAQNQGSN